MGRQTALTGEEVLIAGYTYYADKNKIVCYSSIPGFVKSTTLEDISKHDFSLTLGSCVETVEVEIDVESNGERIERITKEKLSEFDKRRRLEVAICERLVNLTS